MAKSSRVKQSNLSWWVRERILYAKGEDLCIFSMRWSSILNINFVEKPLSEIIKCGSYFMRFSKYFWLCLAGGTALPGPYVVRWDHVTSSEE